MTFDWSDFNQETFEKYCAQMNKQKQEELNGPGAGVYLCEYDYLGAVRVGELCFDLLLRLKDYDDDHSPLVLTFDCYAGGVKYGDEPYAYSRIEPDYPYEDVGGADFPTDCTEYDYHDFQVFAEQEFTKFIKESAENNLQHCYNISRDLRPLAEKPLHKW